MNIVRILVTGERTAASLPPALSLASTSQPIQWTELPVLEFEALPIAQEKLQALSDKPANWILFTSARGVRFWTEAWMETGLDFPLETQVACIGEATADAAGQDGLNADFYPTEPGTEKFLEEFRDLLSNNKIKPTIVIPMAEMGRTTIAEELRALGCQVDVIPLYRTKTKADLAKAISKEEVAKLNALLFTSPSSVEAFLSCFSIPAAARIFALGTFTETSLLEHGLTQTRVIPGSDLNRINEVW